ncbi:MAG: TetR/AcrR family transcriptional regulator, partial [Salinibacter sp.]
MSQADSTATTDGSATADRILDLAQDRIQQRGYNAVSYGDLAEDLDLTTAAIHYHFPSKADL